MIDPMNMAVCLQVLHFPLSHFVTQELIHNMCSLNAQIIQSPLSPLGSDRRYLWWHSADSSSDCGNLCEVLKFTDEPRSWFVENSVQTGVCYAALAHGRLTTAVCCLNRWQFVLVYSNRPLIHRTTIPHGVVQGIV